MTIGVVLAINEDDLGVSGAVGYLLAFESMDSARAWAKTCPEPHPCVISMRWLEELADQPPLPGIEAA